MKATKKPVTIDYFPINEGDSLKKLKSWVEEMGDKYEDHFTEIDQGSDGLSLKVKTLEGTSYNVLPMDIIIRGNFGEYYPIKKTIFKENYDIK